MSDDEDETHCPLCVEEMDLSDQNFLPCPCGYRVCMWCWHHIRENLNGLCPACRTPYNADPHAFSAVDRQEIVKKNKERKQKEKNEKSVVVKGSTGATAATSSSKGGVVSTAQAVVDRRHLHNYRVVQRNLVYVIGVPVASATEELLRKPEYFGQYGKIGKIVIHRNHTAAHTSVSAYVTFVYKEDAKASIQSLDGFWMDGHVLRASFGTTKYCNNFIRAVPCNNPECVYLHDLGDDDDRFTKEEIQAGHSKIPPVPGKDQTIVTGMGGPSGTGKRPIGEPVLPPPVFIQDNNALNNNTSSSSIGTSVNVTQPVMASNNPQSKPLPVSRTGTWSSNASSTATSDRDKSFDGSSNIENNDEGNDKTTPYNTVLPSLSSTSSSPLSTGIAVNTTGPAAAVNRTMNPTTIEIKSKDNIKQVLVNNDKNQDTSTTSPTPSIANIPKLKDDLSTIISNNYIEQPDKHIVNTIKSSTAITTTAIFLSEKGKSFNGLSACAVFPVPTSSLSLSVWAAILQPTSEGSSSSDNNLLVNPYGQLILPFSELLDLTLPPVDATGYATWPKPYAYYRQGSLPNGSTHSVVSKHSHTIRPSNAIATGATPPIPPSNSSILTTPSITGDDHNSSSNDQQMYSSTTIQDDRNHRVNNNNNISNTTTTTASGGTVAMGNNNNNAAGITALRQLFPGVKMSVGGNTN